MPGKNKGKNKNNSHKQSGNNSNSSECSKKENYFGNFLVKQLDKTSIKREEAFAPYNFVPISCKVQKSDFDKTNVQFNKYHSNDRKTGYINITLDPFGPIFIRGMLDNDRRKQLDELEESIKNYKKLDGIEDQKKYLEMNLERLNLICGFFSSELGKLRVPGSSLRGLVRFLVEIISYSKFGFYDNKRLYMRGFADKTLGKVYRQYGMSNLSSGGVTYSMECGILSKSGSGYIIEDSGTAKQISKSKTSSLLGKSGIEFDHYKTKSGYIVVPGAMSKVNNWEIPFPSKGCLRIHLTPEDIEEYQKDENRDAKADLLDKLQTRKEVPCFYKQWTDAIGNVRTSFGHTGMFRLPYRKTIGEHIPDVLKNDSTLDIATAIFGNESDFSGRVFFEDLFEQTELNDSKSVVPQILSSPKPTTFQHYLTQCSDEREELKHYDPFDGSKLSAIRGNKLYWHKKAMEYVDENSDEFTKHISNYTKITPVSKGRFVGRIRFENLSNTELGALLFALDLPEGCAHKIGMGKPLGLGSVKISSSLHLSDRKKRYSELFAEFKDKVSESTNINESNEYFKAEFAKSVIEFLRIDIKGNDYSEKLWNVDRMKELKRMLTLENGIDESRMQYMKLKNAENKNDFKERNVLPKPTDVK